MTISADRRNILILQLIPLAVHNLIFEASITGLFRILLIAFFVYYLLTFLMRYILPRLINHTVRNFQQSNQDQNFSSRATKQKKEGEVTIEFIDGNSKNKSNTNDDEYVDYEEIK